jgi:hypothetical protein
MQELCAMLDETTRARDLTADGQAIPAMRMLLQARRLGKEAIAALLGGCLKAEAEQTDAVSLARLGEQISFTQQSLCPACRSKVGKKWKESENV